MYFFLSKTNVQLQTTLDCPNVSTLRGVVLILFLIKGVGLSRDTGNTRKGVEDRW